MRARRPQVGVVLTAQHRAVRLAFAREHQDWQIRHWRPVLFTDESRFTLSTCDRHDSLEMPWRTFCGVSHGPRGPTSFDYMFPMKLRVQGLKIALSSKLAQDYLHVVDTLNIPTPDPQYLMDLIRYRHWGESVLIVDVSISSEQKKLFSGHPS
uniref:Large ribosomal subunit protein uL4m n=1 Tax=Oncorhynchus kisutch TaxID=8019 RepID=A0A8C7D2A0_ONCKI